MPPPLNACPEIAVALHSGRPDCAAGVARGWVHIKLGKADVAENLPVRDAVEPNAAHNAQPHCSSLAPTLIDTRVVQLCMFVSLRIAA
jgi:hypothetical protein